uniref:Uncharacterized protein n=1 Tax=Arion vulgaris TaxID=1028688 RepID=A0A0B7A2S8_9EUPU
MRNSIIMKNNIVEIKETSNKETIVKYNNQTKIKLIIFNKIKISQTMLNNKTEDSGGKGRSRYSKFEIG